MACYRQPPLANLSAAQVASDAFVLNRLYDSTGGASWLNHSGWLGQGSPCAWHGVCCDRTGAISSVVLFDNNLAGTLPTELGLAMSLERLELSPNGRGLPEHFFGPSHDARPLPRVQRSPPHMLPWHGGSRLSGTLPAQLAALPKLRELNLWGNRISGTLPLLRGQPSELLDLSQNPISGTLPAELSSPKLSGLLLGYMGKLSGTLPTSYGALHGLQVLVFSADRLSGSLPTEYATMRSASILSIEFNGLSGTIPAEYRHVDNLTELWLSNNPLSGSFPDGIIPKLNAFSIDSHWLIDSSFLCYDGADLKSRALAAYVYSCEHLAGLWRLTALLAAVPAFIILLLEWRAWCLLRRTANEIQGAMRFAPLSLVARPRFDAAALRRRVSGSLFSTGFILVLVGGFPTMSFTFYKVPVNAFSSTALLLVPGVVIMLLAVLPTDQVLVLAINGLVALLFIAIGPWLAFEALSVFLSNAGDSLRSREEELLDCLMDFGMSTIITVAGLALLPGVCRNLPARARLRRLWAVLNMSMPLVGLLLLLHYFIATSRTSYWRSVMSHYPHLGISMILSVGLPTARVRGRIRRVLGDLAFRGSEAQQGAVIGALFGRSHAHKLLAKAETNFHVLQLNAIDAAGLEAIFSGGNQPPHHTTSRTTGGHPTQPTPGATLEPEMTVNARLGSCDAFCSHAWSDPAALKSSAIMRWSAARAARTGVPPTIWLDKVCLDVAHIEDSIPMLPIFVSGCQSFLILAGEAWPTRLWTIIELYTFVRMGAKNSRIIIENVGNAEAVTAAFRRIDVSKARCSIMRDKEHLLAVIEAGFGDLAPFSRLVRSILLPAMAERDATPRAGEETELDGGVARAEDGGQA